MLVNVLGPFSECSPAGTGLVTRGEAVAVRMRLRARTDPASDALHPRHSIRLRWLPSESENGAHVERVPARTCPQPHASGEHPHHAFDGNSGVQRLHHHPFADRGARGRQRRGHGDSGLPRDLRRPLLRRAFEPVADKRGRIHMGRPTSWKADGLWGPHAVAHGRDSHHLRHWVWGGYLSLGRLGWLRLTVDDDHRHRHHHGRGLLHDQDECLGDRNLPRT
ncbi:unannotated protein [freshwater metagenome]|uniref:Unannotated protein n=1 Tax=freshwater metagenome TaxID=449393 RepID=A0A6J6TI13_9ZZZZ